MRQYASVYDSTTSTVSIIFRDTNDPFDQWNTHVIPPVQSKDRDEMDEVVRALNDQSRADYEKNRNR